MLGGEVGSQRGDLRPRCFQLNASGDGLGLRLARHGLGDGGRMVAGLRLRIVMRRELAIEEEGIVPVEGGQVFRVRPARLLVPLALLGEEFDGMVHVEMTHTPMALVGVTVASASLTGNPSPKSRMYRASPCKGRPLMFWAGCGIS